MSSFLCYKILENGLSFKDVVLECKGPVLELKASGVEHVLHTSGNGLMGTFHKTNSAGGIKKCALNLVFSIFKKNMDLGVTTKLTSTTKLYTIVGEVRLIIGDE